MCWRQQSRLLVTVLLFSCSRAGFAPSDEQPVSEVPDGVTSCQECDLGCSSTNACRQMIPSNVGRRVDMSEGQSELVVGDGLYFYWVFDADTGAITSYATPDRNDAATRTIRKAGFGDDVSGITFTPLSQAGSQAGVEIGLGVFSLKSLEVLQGAWLIGVGSRALVILAQTDIIISGIVTVGADRLAPYRHAGAGGFPGAGAAAVHGEGDGHGLAGAQTRAGGGGASFAGYGGIGGHTGGGSAGLLRGGDANIPLVGGAGGGAGFTSGTGGHGGGALQLSARNRLEVRATGHVDARGGGGRGASDGGGGGGSGGAIVLEAYDIVLDGFVGANGGAGGGLLDAHGEPGEADRAPAQATDGIGGLGSATSGVAGDGQVSGGTRGGGGGGGGGRIRLNTASGELASFDGQLLPTTQSGLATLGTILTLAEDEFCVTGRDRCVARGLERCVDGSPIVEPCALGCGGQPASCAQFVPGNIEGAGSGLMGTADFVVGQDSLSHWVLNTDDGSIDAFPTQSYTAGEAMSIRLAGLGDIDGSIFTDIAQGTGETELGIMQVGSLMVPEGSSLIAIGSRALVLHAAQHIDIQGMVSVGADWLPDAPQAGAGGHSGGGQERSAGYGPGGGDGARGNRAGNGGGFGKKGGEGDNFGGDAYGNAVLIPLWGGSGGSASGEGGSSCATRGGNGGGALNLSAGTMIRVGALGVVDARGGGGRGGTQACAGGGGGGSGGGLLIEAPAVEIFGYVSANGGSGGRGHDASSPVAHGFAGLFHTAPVLGPPSTTQAGFGAHGGDGWGNPGWGDFDYFSPQGAAGGASGRIRINTATGAERFDFASMLPLPLSGLATFGALQVGR